MKLRISIKYIFLSTALILLAVTDIVSQTGTKVDPASTDTIIAGDEVLKHTLFTGTGYGSNMIYMGSTLSKNQPYGYAAISYGYKEALYATLSSVHLSGFDPIISFNIASLNYNHVFNSWFDISAGFYGYQVEKSLTDTLFKNFLYGDFTLGVDWKLLYSKLSAGMLFSEENQTYLQVRNSRYFRTPDFFKKKFYLSFDPYANILMGNYEKQEILSGTSVSLSTVSRRWGQSNPDTGNTAYTFTDYVRTFGVIEAEFGIPVALNTDRMSLEIETSYVLPVSDNLNYPGYKGLIFMVSCYFRIF